MKKAPKKLTFHENLAVNGRYNLADGHARHDQSKKQRSILLRLPAIYKKAQTEAPRQIEREFAHKFYAVAGQAGARDCTEPLYYTSASLALEVVANYLRYAKKSVMLSHPTFDNLADILKRHDVPLSPLEDAFFETDLIRDADVPSDAIFVVCPNNPTGKELSKDKFSRLVDYCKKYKKLLIFDFSFCSGPLSSDTILV